jgi:hypothetical protein
MIFTTDCLGVLASPRPPQKKSHGSPKFGFLWALVAPSGSVAGNDEVVEPFWESLARRKK